MSNKALLVMDMPNECEKCPLCNLIDYTCGVFEILGKNYTYEVPESGVADWCPLKPMPEKKEEPKIQRMPTMSEYRIMEFCSGWNACIDEITGGDE